MNNKGTYLLFATLLGLLGVVGVSQFFGDAAPSSDYLLSSLHDEKILAENIDTLVLEYGNPVTQKFVFVREGPNRWKMTEPTSARVEGFTIENVVRDILDARIDPKADVTTNLPLHGLDKPTVSVTLKRGTDTDASVKLGNVVVGGDDASVYALTSEQPSQPVAIKRSSLRALFKRFEPANEPNTSNAVAYVRELNDFRTLKLLSLEMPQGFEETQRIMLSEGKSDLVIQRGTGGEWLIEIPAGMGTADPEGAPPGVDQAITGVRPLLSNLSSYRAAAPEDIVTDISDPAKLGFDNANPMLIKITIIRRPLTKDATPITETLLIGKNADELGTKVYAMLQGDSVAMKVAGGPGIKALRNLIAEPKLIRDRTLTRITPAATDAIQMSSAGEALEFFRVGTPAVWTIFDSAGSPLATNQQSLDQLLTALAEPRKIANFPASGQTDAALGFDKPQGELKVWTDGIAKEAKKEDSATTTKPTLKGTEALKIIFGKTEGDFVYIRRIIGKETTDAIVPESLLRLVQRKRVEYLDPKLPTFVTTQVKKLGFEQAITGGKMVSVYQVERDAKQIGTPPVQSTWTLLSPEAVKGRNADPGKVNTILTNLSSLKPLKLVADKPSPDALTSWGLTDAAPVGRATIDIQEGMDAGKSRVYLFGKTTEDQSGIYAKIVGSDLVFTVPKFTFDIVSEPEMMDLVIYRIDPSKITRLKLTGWAKLVGTPLVREFEKKGDTWAMVGMNNYDIDPRKVVTFLEDIAAPRAEKFVTFKTGPTADQGFDLNTDALEIAITVAGEATPMTLTLGKADSLKIGRAGAEGNALNVYYAQSNRQPGDVFVVLQDRFKALRESAAVFRR